MWTSISIFDNQPGANLLTTSNRLVTNKLSQLTIAKKMACQNFTMTFFASLNYINTSYEKFDLSTYVLVDNTLLSLILMP